jgi:hypothetical protein
VLRSSPAALVFALTLAGSFVFAQPRQTRLAAPTTPAPRPSRRNPERIALAAAQGASDELVLALTEVRGRRHPVRPRDTQAPPAPCLHAPVEIRRLRTRDAPQWSGALTDCAGHPTLGAMAALALLAQPQREFQTNLGPAVTELRRVVATSGWTLTDENPLPRVRRRARTPAPTVPRDPATHDPMIEVSQGVRVLHPRLVQLLQTLSEHYPGESIEIVSGYRPTDGDSRHAHARALDLRIRHVTNEDLRDFARTLPNVGVGYYPNSIFVHLDVRDPDEGRATWTDFSGPGETPRYGHWPPTDEDIQSEVGYLVHRNEDALQRAREREDPPPRDSGTVPAP